MSGFQQGYLVITGPFCITPDTAGITDLNPPSMPLRNATFSGGVTAAAFHGIGQLSQITVFQGSLIAQEFAIETTATWDNAAVLFTHWFLNVDDFASDVNSLLVDWQVNSASVFSVRKDGKLAAASGIIGTDPGGTDLLRVGGAATIGGSRSIRLDPSGGYTSIAGNAGGWATGYFFVGSSGALFQGFGAAGTGNTLSFLYVGTNGSAPAISIAPGDSGVVTFGGAIIIGTDPGGTDLLRVGGAATIGGGLTIASGNAFKLGNAYVAGAPAATGYVTIQDSTGTTYKLPASL